jgi:hypothetical protein
VRQIGSAQVSAPSYDSLLEQACQLDAAAIHAGETTDAGRSLRAQAAALRISAIGSRDYPVIACGNCYRITGWVDGAGRCDFCARHLADRAAAARGAWAAAAPGPATPSAPRAPLRARLGARLGGEGARKQAVRAWFEHVEPGETGPVEPEVGYRTEVALRDEIERTDQAGVLVRFTTSEHRFGGASWERSAITHIGRSEMPNPTEFSASLPVESLVAAWSDYQQAVAAYNRGVWRAQSTKRDQVAAAAAARAEALREQQHTAELLQE